MRKPTDSMASRGGRRTVAPKQTSENLLDCFLLAAAEASLGIVSYSYPNPANFRFASRWFRTSDCPCRLVDKHLAMSMAR